MHGCTRPLGLALHISVDRIYYHDLELHMCLVMLLLMCVSYADVYYAVAYVLHSGHLYAVTSVVYIRYRMVPGFNRNS